VGQSRYGDGQEFSWQQVEVKKQWHENCHGCHLVDTFPICGDASTNASLRL